MSDHDEFSDSLAPYALGALPDAERRRLEAHLRGCHDCQLVLRELGEVTQLLPLAVELREPSPALRARLLEAARRESSGGILTAPRGAWPGVRTRVAGLVAVAAAIAVVALGSIDLSLQRQLEEARRAPKAPTVAVYTFKGNDRAPGAVALLNYYPDNMATLVVVKGLPPLREGRVYALWVIHGGAPIARGTPPVSGSGDLRSVLWDDLRDIEKFVITDEPAPGGPQPLGPPILVGAIQRG